MTHRLRGCVRALTLAVCLAACDAALPSERAPSLDARWVGAIALDTLGDSLQLDMLLHQVADSVLGTVSKPYGAQSVLVSGVRVGDSVRIHLLPAEDASTDIAGIVAATTISGEFWFSISPTVRFPLLLRRTP